MAKSFNGYRSWNEWNVSLWINNDEFLYQMAQDLIDEYEEDAVKIFCSMFKKTPDGAEYNESSVRTAFSNL